MPSDEEINELSNLYRTTHREMLELGEAQLGFEDYPEPCNNSAGCFWCQFGQDSENDFFNHLSNMEISISPPSQRIGGIQSGKRKR